MDRTEIEIQDLMARHEHDPYRLARALHAEQRRAVRVAAALPPAPVVIDGRLAQHMDENATLSNVRRALLGETGER